MLCRKQSVVVVALAALLASACAMEEDAPTGDQLVGESTADGEDTGKSDFANTTFTYYTVRPDYRRCMYPVCGGNWVSRVNRLYTRCVDGSWSDEGCYVVGIEWDKLGLPAAQVDEAKNGRYLLRGSIQEMDFENHGTLGHFEPTEMWSAATDAEPAGLMTKVKDSGLRCITTPCFSMNEYKLNSWLWIDLSELDFDWSGASQALVDEAHTAVASDDGLIVAGYRYWRRDNRQWSRGRAVTQFYTRVVPAPKPSTTCYVGGCSSQLCSDQEGLISTCEWRPEYACYRTATCEVQDSGECGWTPTDELRACLD